MEGDLIDKANISASVPSELKRLVAANVKDGALREKGITSMSAAVERGLRLVLKDAGISAS